MCFPLVSESLWFSSQDSERLTKHPRGLQNFFHQYVSAPKKQAKNKFEQYLLDKNPNMKVDDATTLSSVMSKSEQKQYMEEQDPNAK